MKQLIKTICVALLTLCATLPAGAAVGDSFTEGSFRYTILTESPNTAAVSGLGGDYFLDLHEKMVIPETVTYQSESYTVTTVGSYAFSGGWTETNEIVLPNTVTSIGEMAFSHWHTLKAITLSENLTSIGDRAFEYCDFTEIVLPNSVTALGEGVFEYCRELQSVTLSSSLTSIGDKAFSDCRALTEITLPNSVTSLGNSVFTKCTALTRVVLSDNLTRLSDYLFQDCGNLAYVALPSKLGIIGIGTFKRCVKLEKVEIPNSAKVIDAYAFDGCSGLTSVTLPPSVTTIGSYAFANCATLTAFYFPNTITTLKSRIFENTPIETLSVDCKEIPVYAFAMMPALTTLKLGNSVERVADGAFHNCENLRYVELGERVSFIAAETFETSSPFYQCPIEEVVINGTVVGDGWFGYLPTLKTVKFRGALKSIGAHAFSECSLLAEVQFPESLVSIGESAFTGCPLAEVQFPASLVSIGSYAFAGCPLAEVQFPSSLSSIGDHAFNDNQISILTLPKSLTSLGEGVFSGCKIEKLYVNTSADLSRAFEYRFSPFEYLTEAVFGDDAQTIPSFRGATRLTKVVLPTPMEVLPRQAFQYCSALEDIELPPGLKEIGVATFERCTSLVSLLLPETLTSIWEGAFIDCANLTGLEIPDNVTYIGEQAFAHCSSLTSLRLPENLTQIPDLLFKSCTKLEKVYFSDKVTTIGEGAFAECPALRSMIIPAGVAKVPYFMMQNCTSLTEILIPNTVNEICPYAFQGCTSLRNIDLGTGLYVIGDYAFDGCPAVKEIHSMALNPPFANTHSFPPESYQNSVVTVREQSLTIYNSELPWSHFANYMTVPGAISLSHYQVEMAGNEVFQLGVYGAQGDIEWTSSNPSVAYANKCGLIVAMGITGITTITAHVGGDEINCRVVVSSISRQAPARAMAYASEAEEESMEPVDIIIESVSGNPPMVNARLIPIGSCTVIDWTSSDDSMASVENGIVSIHAEGDVEFGTETENGLSETLESDTKNIGTTSIEPVAPDEETPTSGDVYDLTGRRLLRNATPEQISRLSKGIYIVGGRKVLVK